MFFIILCCVVFVLYRWICRSSRDPPQGPGGMPIIGHAYSLMGDNTHVWNFIKSVTSECLAGEQASTVNVGRKFYAITDPDDCLTVVNACLQKNLFYDFAKPGFGDGLVSAPVTTLGMDFKNNNDLNTKYIEASDNIFNIIIKRVAKVWLHSNFIWNFSSMKKIHDENVKTLHSVSDKLLQKRKKKYICNEIDNNEFKGENFKPILDILFELKPTYGQETLSDQTIREHVDTFIVAGNDTVACTLLYTMLLIGSYPQVQDKIFAELHDIFGESDRDVTKEDLTRLVYLECVIKEAMRIYPVIPAIARYLDKDVKLKNHTLSSGHECILMIYGVLRHGMWGEDADQFKPERWLEPSKLPENPNAFVSFSLGRRDCIGKTYAMFSMKTSLSHVLRNYRVSGDHTKMINEYDFILKPVSGYYISIERRF